MFLIRRRRGARDRAVSAGSLRILLGSHTPSWIRSRVAQRFLRTERATQLGLAALSTERLLALLADREQSSLLTGHPAPRALLKLVGQHPDLLAAALVLLREADAELLGGALYQTIVLNRDGASGLNVAFAAAAANAGRLPPQQARAIFERCLAIIAAPPDPYDPAAARASGAARQAAAAILAGNSEFDELVLKAMRDETARPNLQMLVASALKERPDRAAGRFVRYLPDAGLTTEQLIRFAEDCDADRGALREVAWHHRTPGGRFIGFVKQRSGAWLPAAGWLLMPPIVAAVLALLARHASTTLASAGIGPAVVIGALAVLAAVHVLSVQLAAQRLPGPIAAATVAPPIVVSAYITAVLMLVMSILGEEDPPPSWAPSLVASGLLVVFVGLVVGATMLSLRTTGAAAASEAVGRRRTAQARRTGARAGDLHRTAGRMQQVVDAYPSLRRFPSPRSATHRYPIKAASSGYLDIDLRGLQRLAERPRLVAGDVHIDLLVAPGVPVTPGQEIASAIPVGATTLEGGDLRAAERTFKVRSERKLERFAELCVSLCSQIPVLVDAGDPGGGRRVLHVLLDLLRVHLDRDARVRGEFTGPLPLSPALTQVIDKALAELAHAPTREQELLGRLFTEIFEFARKDDGVITMSAGRLAAQATTLTDFGVLCDAGIRAILLESSQELALLQHSLSRITGGTTEAARYANEAAGRLVAFCAAVNPRLSRAAWTRWWKAAARTPEHDRVQIALRIGAAALPVANLSLAVEVALAISDQDLDTLTEELHEPARSSFERFLSEGYGRLLGVDAEQRLIDFIEFARSVLAARPDLIPAV